MIKKQIIQNKAFRIILIGNYQADNLMSMNLFCEMLYKGYIDAGQDTEIWRPLRIFGLVSSNTTEGFGKWMSYVDKWLVFPLIILIRRLHIKNWKANLRFQICDHSNAIYISYLPNNRTIVSLHDVLAIRGAFGFKDAYCEASRFGVILQRWILKSLQKANRIAAVSNTTLNLLLDLSGRTRIGNKDWRVILNSYNEDFYQLPSVDAFKMLQKYNISSNTPFILHVGSSLPRKNRGILVEMLSIIKDQWQGIICFAGEPIDSDMQTQIDSKDLNERVISVKKPNHDELLALYSTCDAFIFPSFSEGFGWPIIEAQICGAAVITSNIQPMIEVSGAAALLEDPNDGNAFASAFLKLQDKELKNDFIVKGFENSKRFNPKNMIQSYLSFHQNIKMQ